MSSTKDRRQSDRMELDRPGLVTMTVPAHRLRAITGDAKGHIASPPAAKDFPAPPKDATAPNASPSNNQSNKNRKSSNTHPHAPNETSVIKGSSLDNASESAPNTPGGGGTPAPQAAMAPPVDGPPKKKGGAKRSAANAGIEGAAAVAAASSGIASAGPASVNGDAATPKVRSKPGPKKKQKLDDSILESGRGTGAGAGAAHKLGPKASMGAINAGLRALDRSGKPCRKWTRGPFPIKTFTGVVWELSRWRAPPKPSPVDATASVEDSATATASVDGSNKENNTDAQDAKGKTTKSKNKEAKAADKREKTKAQGPAADNGHLAVGSADGDADIQSSVPSAQPSPPPATDSATEATGTPVAVTA